MKFLFQRVSTRRGERWREIEAPTARRHFVCRCGKPVFFRNSVCLACATPLGYDPDLGELLPLEPDAADGTWHHAEHPAARRTGCAPTMTTPPAATGWCRPAPMDRPRSRCAEAAG